MRHGTTITAVTAGLGLAMAAGVGASANAATNTGGGPLPAGTTPINILNINDFHGRIVDAKGTGALGKDFACTLLTQRAELGSNVLTLGAGDLIGATPFASAVQQDTPTIEYLNALGLDTSAVGNHEFDKGWDDLTNRVVPLATYHYVGANVYLKGTTTPALPEYESYDIAGVRVAVIGAVTESTPSLVAGAGIASLDFGDPVAAVNRVAGELTDGNAANGEADVLIAEYHEGGPYSSTTGTLADQLAVPVFAHLVNDTSAKVAAILQGHTHQAYVYDVQVPGAPTGSTRPVLQTGLYGGAVGRIQLGVDPATKQVVAYNAANVTVTATTPTCEADATWQAAAKIVDDAVAYAAPLAAQQIGSETGSLSRAFNNGAEDRGRESTLSNLIAQSYLESVNAPDRLGADIGIMNPGGVRGDLPYGTDGTITFAQAANIMPFGNTIKTAEYTGAQIKQLLEEQWQPVTASKPYLQLGLSDNVTYTYDPTQPAGSRITSITLGGKPIDLAKSYTIVSNSFLVTNVGAAPDGFATMLQGANYRDSGLVDQNMFMDWVKANSPISPSLKKHAVAVIGAPDPFQVGTKVSFTVEGLNFTSLDAAPNTRLVVFVNGKRVATTKVSDVVLEAPLPMRDGQAAVKLRIQWDWFRAAKRTLPKGTPRPIIEVPVTMTFVAQPSGTTVTFPVIFSRATALRT